MTTFAIEVTPDSSNGTIAHAVGKFSGGVSSYKGQRRMNVTVSSVGTFSALSPETSGGENTFSLYITGLMPGTTYNWSASLYYKNTSEGWVTIGSQYDRSGSFTTANSGTTSTVPLSAKAVRSTVKLNVNGAAKEFIIVHKGKPSSMYDDSCNGVWLLMKDIYEMRQWNSNSELLYENSSIHSYLNSTFLNLFDANIRNAIKQVKIPYLKGGKGGSVQSGANGLSCKVFLLGSYELNFTRRDIFPADGAGLDGFAESIINNPAYLATYNGTLTKWWLRSISTLEYSNNAGLVSGYTYDTESVTESKGIRPCIILPSNTLVDNSDNVIPVDLPTHKTLVNGTVYEVKGGKTLVNGTVYNILKGRTLINGTGYNITLPGAGTKVSTLEIGQSVYAKVNGVTKEFIIVHQGKPSIIYDDSCNGTWLLMKDIFEETTRWHSSDVNNLENSTIHSILNSTFLNLFESNIRDAIKQVKLPYRKNGGSGGSDHSGANGLLCKIFLLSGYEIGLTISDNPYFPVDGAKLSYFEAGTGSSARNKRIAYLNGSANYWYLRSPITLNTSLVWLVDYDGVCEASKASRSSGIRPALVLRSDAIVDDKFNIIS